MKKKQSIDFPTIEYKLSNGITLLIHAWTRILTKSRRFNSPVIGYDETDWHVSIELKMGKGEGLSYHPTLASFRSGHNAKEVKTLLKSLGVDNNETYQSLLIVIRSLKNEAIELSEKW